MFKSKLFIHALILFFYAFLPSKIFASDQFETAFKSVYKVSLTGQTTVYQTITLKNRYSNIFATEYSLQVGSVDIDNIKAVTKSGENIPITVNTTDNSTAITVNFPDQVVGKGKEQSFIITYTNPDITLIHGQVLELYIPRISNLDQIEHLEVVLEVPKKFGFPTLTNPKTFITNESSDLNTYTFSKTDLKNKGITALFGRQQYYSLTLNYHLENPSSANGITQIAIPPDTAYQKVYLNTFEPPPEKISPDEDGNWLATYSLKPKQKLDVVLQAQVTVSIEPSFSVPEYTKDLNQYLKPKEYWPSEDPAITKLAQELGSVEEIYNFLVENFTYNYQKLDTVSAQRQGASYALQNPEDVICQEFTDTFIALARALKIPAREHNGYAFTQNERLRPLSLISDVLHSWPEYYDVESKHWIPVDPTWGNTTGGVDYFNALDLNHITFAIHGLDSSRPYPAGYYKFEDTQGKDIIVDLSTQMPQQNLNYTVDISAVPSSFFGLPSPATIKLTNFSNQALYNASINLSSPSLKNINPSSSQLEYFLPYSQTKISTTFTPKKLFNTKPHIIFIDINNHQLSHELKPVQNSPIWVFIIFGIFLVVVIVSLAFYTRGILVSRRKR